MTTYRVWVDGREEATDYRYYVRSAMDAVLAYMRSMESCLIDLTNDNYQIVVQDLSGRITRWDVTPRVTWDIQEVK